MKKEKFTLLVILGLMIFWMLPGRYNLVMAATVLPTNVTTASEGNTLVGVEGSFATDVQEAIKLVNKYRLEACKKGYPNPNDPSKKLTESDYVPIKWSSDLEYIARIRAAEGSIYSSHTRPNGESCFSISAANGVDSYAEVLAWGGSTIVSSVKMWYSEKETWVNQEDGVTGHYTSMISPKTTYMGMANFNGTGAGEFTNEAWVSFDGLDVNFDTTPLPEAKDVIQTVEVATDKLSSPKVNVESKLVMGDTAKIGITYTYDGDEKVCYLGDVKWSCNSNKIKLSEDGTITPVKVGKYKITFTYSGSMSGKVTKKITIQPKTPTIKKVTMSKTSAKIKFTKVSGITGYQLRYMYGSFWNPTTKTINVSKTATTYQIKGLKRKTSVGFDIRAYKKVGTKTCYSDWSSQIYKDTK